MLVRARNRYGICITICLCSLYLREVEATCYGGSYGCASGCCACDGDNNLMDTRIGTQLFSKTQTHSSVLRGSCICRAGTVGTNINVPRCTYTPINTYWGYYEFVDPTYYEGRYWKTTATACPVNSTANNMNPIYDWHGFVKSTQAGGGMSIADCLTNATSNAITNAITNATSNATINSTRSGVSTG
jgi:hypothetical protein